MKSATQGQKQARKSVRRPDSQTAQQTVIQTYTVNKAGSHLATL